MIKKLGRPPDPDGPRKRFQAVIAPATLRWLESKKKPPGRVIDDLVEKAIKEQ